MSPRKREVNSKLSHSGTASTENFTHGNPSSEPHIEKTNENLFSDSKYKYPFENQTNG